MRHTSSNPARSNLARLQTMKNAWSSGMPDDFDALMDGLKG
jgi:hypothetical protein